jgi:hypothetical protein
MDLRILPDFVFPLLVVGLRWEKNEVKFHYPKALCMNNFTSIVYIYWNFEEFIGKKDLSLISLLQGIGKSLQGN